MTKKFRILLIVAFLGPVFGAAGQQPTAADTSLKTYSAGIHVLHLFDLPASRFDNEMSQDMRGLNGDKTQLDFGVDLYGEKQFTPLLGLQLGFRYARLSGANDLEYYRNRFSEVYLDGVFSLSNLDLFHANTAWNFYAKAGLGYGNYQAEQFLISDDAADDVNKGSFWESHLGAGVQYELNSYLRLELESNYNIAYTDGFDGYNYGSGSDPYLTTALGIAYTFGPKEHKAMYATNYFGESYVPAADNIAAEELAAANASEIAALKKRMEEQDARLVQNERKLNEQDREIKVLKEAISTAKGSMSIYFDFDSAQLSREGKMKLAESLPVDKALALELTAYADNYGSNDYNQKLKQKRAESVKGFLVETLGFNADQITIAKAEAPKLGLENQFLNRKVVIKY